MNRRQNLQQTYPYKQSRSSSHLHFSPPTQRSTLVLALSLTLIVLVTILHGELFFSMRELQQNQVDFSYTFQGANQTASRLKDSLSSLQNKIERYSSQELNVLQEDINKLYVQAIQADPSESFQDDSGLVKSISEIEQRQQERKVMLEMVDANLKQFVRSQRIQLFERIGNTSEFKPNKIRGPWNLTRLNFQPAYMDTVERKIFQLWIRNETERLQKDYSIHLVFRERPICVISIAKNNAKDYQYEYNLQSILNQNYSNYKMIIIDQGSTDGTKDLIKKFMRDHQKLPSSYSFIQAKQGQSRTELLHFAIHNHCHPSDIAVVLDGSDQLLGTMVFKLLSARYQQNNLSVAYSNYFSGFPKKQQYSPTIIQPPQQQSSGLAPQTTNYRGSPKAYGPFVSFEVKSFLNIKVEHLKDVNGRWMDEDEVYMIPLLQMSCGKVEHLDEYLYLIQYETDQHPAPPEARDKDFQQQLERLKPYRCLDIGVNKKEETN